MKESLLGKWWCRGWHLIAKGIHGVGIYVWNLFVIWVFSHYKLPKHVRVNVYLSLCHIIMQKDTLCNIIFIGLMNYATTPAVEHIYILLPSHHHRGDITVHHANNNAPLHMKLVTILY